MSPALRCAAALPCAAALLLAGCEREARRLQVPPAPAAAASVARTSSILPGPAASAAPADTAASQPPSSGEDNAYAVAQGKRLFRWYNCNGCHSAGGGGMGPALMDARWRYGHEPAQVVQSILQGRPNGMPSFAGRMPEDQAWQIAAYVRSMSGQLRADVLPGRSDGLAPGEPEVRRDKLPPRPGP
jgi:cytochrome c oxidase cbb3-type subunit III